MQALSVHARSFGDPAPNTSRPHAASTAQDFEALLIAQMLKSARTQADACFGSERDGDSGISDLAEQQLAHVLSRAGGLGIAQMITSHVTAQAAHASSTDRPR